MSDVCFARLESAVSRTSVIRDKGVVEVAEDGLSCFEGIGERSRDLGVNHSASLREEVDSLGFPGLLRVNYGFLEGLLWVCHYH